MVLALTTVAASSASFLHKATSEVNKEQRGAGKYIDVEVPLRKKARSSFDGPASPISIAELVSVVPPGVKAVSHKEADGEQPKTGPTGRWSLDEKLLFLYGLSLFGKGRWKKIHLYVPDRSLVQIKSHAQKVLKRVDAGENVFQRLEENRERVKALVAEANRKIAEKEAKLNQAQQKKKRKRIPIVVATTTTASKSDSFKSDSFKLVTPPTTVTTTASTASTTSTENVAAASGTVTPPLVSSPWDIIHRQPNSQQTRSRRAQRDAPCSPSSGGESSSLPSADPPGVHASYSDDEESDASAHVQAELGSSAATTTTASSKQGAEATSSNGNPSNGSGAVIAAVAALCQLSARDP